MTLPAQQKETRTCARCGSRIPRGAPEGLCISCLLDSALIDPAESGSHAPSITPRFFGDYELLEEVGRGGMGVVYKARQFATDRIVALKLLASGTLATRDAVHRFHTEAQAAARLEHTGIVPLYEAGVHDGQYFLVMQFLAGGTLQTRIAKGLPTPPETARIIIAVASALGHAHRRGVLHRDLKPGNVLLDAEGTPRIADFGLARLDEAESNLTLSRAVLGTAAYLAPEVASGGAARATIASDIYGLGAILYELLTGRPPFMAESFPALLKKIAEEEPVAPSQVARSVPSAARSVVSKPETSPGRTPISRDLETICLKCLEKDPAKRYATAQELADELGHFLRNEPIQARPIMAIERAWRWCRRRPALAAALLVILILLLVVIIGSPIALFRINRERQRAEASRLQAQAQAYTSGMNMALQAWEDGNLKRAQTLLRAHIPKPGERDLRGFEWRYLWRLCRDESRKSFTNFAGTVHFTWSPDRRFLAVASEHDVKPLALDGDGAELNLISDPADIISTLAFSPASTNTLATGCESGAVKLWDLTTKQSLAVFTGLSNGVSALAFSPDGRYLAAAARLHKKIALWDVPRHTNLWFRETAVPSVGVIFPPDGHSLISGGGPDAGNALLWDLDGNATPFPAEHKGWVQSMVLSPDGKLLATGSADSTTIIWDLATRKNLRRLSGSGGAAFSPDGQQFALGDGATLSLWNLSTGERLARFRGHEDGIEAVAFSPDGRSILSGAYRSLKVWDLQPRAMVETLTGHSNWIGRIEFSSDGKLLASLSYFRPFFTRLWDVQSWTAITDLLGPTAPALGMRFSSDVSMLATGSADKTIHIWNPTTHALLMILTNDSRASAPSFSRDNRILAVADAGWAPGGKCLVFWDIPSRQRIRKLEGYETNATAVAFGHKSDLLAIGYFDGTVRVWDFPQERLLCEFKQHSGLVWSLAFNQYDTLLASGSDDTTAAIYDIPTRRAFPPLRDHAGIVWSVAFNHDGKTLATASADSTIKLWELTTRKPALTLKGHLGAVAGVAFMPDDQLMATSGADGTIRLWRAASLQDIPQYESLK